MTVNIRPEPLVWNELQLSNGLVARRYNPNTDSEDRYLILGSKKSWEAYVNGNSLGAWDSRRHCKELAQKHADRQCHVWNEHN